MSVLFKDVPGSVIDWFCGVNYVTATASRNGRSIIPRFSTVYLCPLMYSQVIYFQKVSHGKISYAI